MFSYAGSEGYMSRDPSRDPHESDNENSKPPAHRVRFDLPDSQENRIQTPARRLASVYDAVAGRVSVRGFVPSQDFVSKYRDTKSSGARDLHPEEVLYRNKTKYLKKLNSMETDSYFAHEKLPADRPLPNSELLTAIHAYTSEFYTNLPENSKRDFHSLDESALLAVGILMEELADEQLGETGDMVLTEEQWASEDEHMINNAITNKTDGNDEKKLLSQTQASKGPGSLHHQKKATRQKTKRHRLSISESTRRDGLQEHQSPKKKKKYK